MSDQSLTSGTFRNWRFNGFQRLPRRDPLIMGIVNVTPDSFSDGGCFLAEEAAVAHAIKLVNEGADLLDIGGESTRPGASPVSAEEEIRRVIPVIEQLKAKVSIPISIDTSKANVARAALKVGATIVNDISGLQFDPEMIPLCAENRCGVIAMHIQGTPQTMQNEPHYENVVREITDYFNERMKTLTDGGIELDAIALDPGVGFGKTAQHNIEILSNVQQFQALGRPVLIGHSRKRFLQKVIGKSVDERLFGTVGTSVGLAAQDVDILRVHDVAANRDAITAFQAIQG